MMWRVRVRLATVAMKTQHYVPFVLLRYAMSLTTYEIRLVVRVKWREFCFLFDFSTDFHVKFPM
jgi:hypothetical protein